MVEGREGRGWEGRKRERRKEGGLGGSGGENANALNSGVVCMCEVRPDRERGRGRAVFCWSIRLVRFHY